MATVVLQTVGAAVGGAIGGPFGATLGRAAGAMAGSFIDQKLNSKDQVIEGPRLDNAQVLTVNVGAPIPKAYGYNRLAGEIIWATRFEEVATTTAQSSGGKGTGGGPSATTTEFSYFANFAVGVCDGPISGIRRIWADNNELDLTRIEYRVYTGDENQLPDPLIEAKQGLGNVPAYRGTAYVVFEGLPLEDYGNRIPQITFEVIHSIGSLEKQIKSMTVIPGSTEYGYDTQLVSIGGQDEPFAARNRHTSIAETDWQASIDELQSLCPNLQSVSLVITWFGTDLRAGECDIIPGVTLRQGPSWSVAGLNRSNAHIVSKVDGRPAYGGTPSDEGILRAIADLKARGLKVILYPFIMMDIPNGNQLPGLFGESTQSVYPWRGQISCFPGPGENNTADKTTLARSQLADFSDQYSAFIRHYISLVQNAGGVDGFLVGSELRGLTRVRDENGKFPFVETLINLSAEAKSALGSECFVTYSADWSEYFGYQPQDGSGDVFYNLDPLWASSSVDAIGIDNYMPLADWRDIGDPEEQDIFSPYDLEYLKNNMAANEGFDWYYANDIDRKNNYRTPITDGEGEPWVFRFKDLVSWWSLPHHERPGGLRQNTATQWVPKSKPIFFTEIGCPAIEKGANQPNVFHDPKSDQSNIPHFSSGARDDLIQRRFLEAYYAYWNEGEHNPVSPIYNGNMLAVDLITPWAWDARPFPWFPLDTNAWSDGENWHTGHWLNGRLGACSLQDLVAHILGEFGIEDFECRLDGYLEGYVIPSQSSARDALEPLLQLFDVHVLEDQGRIIFQQAVYADRMVLDHEDILQEEDEPQKVETRESELELPSEIILKHGSVFQDYEQRATKSRRLDGGSDRQVSIQLPAVMSEITALELAEKRLRQDWQKRKTCKLSVSNAHFKYSPGDVLKLDLEGQSEWIIESKDTGRFHDLELRSYVDLPRSSSASRFHLKSFQSLPSHGKPLAILMDLPLLNSVDDGKTITHLAIHAEPWGGPYSAYSSPSQDSHKHRGFATKQSVIGKLRNNVSAGPLGFFDRNNLLHIELLNGDFQSTSPLNLLNGANLLAVEAMNGDYEIIQFQNAELLQDGSWILSHLLRGQLGTETAMRSGLGSDGYVIAFDERLTVIELDALEIGLEQNWRIGPARDLVASDNYATQNHANSRRSGRMLSPTHLRWLETPDSGIQFSWVRRGRINSDSWENAEIPLDANALSFQITIEDVNKNSVRQISLSEMSFEYGFENRISDLGSEQAPFVFKVAQIGDTGLPGDFAELAYNS